MTNFLITLFLGWAGVHKFAEKKIITGIIYLCTFGLFGIGWIIDILKATKLLLTKKPKQSITSFDVAGTYYCRSSIASLLSGNTLFTLPDDAFIKRVAENDYIFKYKKRTAVAQLVLEPTNPHDPNAIKIIIDDAHVGYVPAHFCIEIKKHFKKYEKMNAVICSGDFKYHNRGEVYKKEADFKIELTLK